MNTEQTIEMSPAWWLRGWSRKCAQYDQSSDPLDLRAVHERHERAVLRARWLSRVRMSHPSKQ